MRRCVYCHDPLKERYGPGDYASCGCRGERVQAWRDASPSDGGRRLAYLLSQYHHDDPQEGAELAWEIIVELVEDPGKRTVDNCITRVIDILLQNHTPLPLDR